MGTTLEQLRAKYGAPEGTEVAQQRDRAADLRKMVADMEQAIKDGLCPVCHDARHWGLIKTHPTCTFKPSPAAKGEATPDRRVRRLAVEAMDHIKRRDAGELPPGAPPGQGTGVLPAGSGVDLKSLFKRKRCHLCGAEAPLGRRIPHGAECPEARVGAVEEDDPAEAARAVRARAATAHKMSGKYDIHAPSVKGGSPDATLYFGRHRGKRVSDLADDSDTIGYLRWLVKEDFPDDLINVVRHYI